MYKIIFFPMEELRSKPHIPLIRLEPKSCRYEIRGCLLIATSVSAWKPRIWVKRLTSVTFVQFRPKDWVTVIGGAGLSAYFVVSVSSNLGKNSCSKWLGSPKVWLGEFHGDRNLGIYNTIWNFFWNTYNINI